MESVAQGQIAREHADVDHVCWGCEFDFGKPSDPMKRPGMAQLWQVYVRGNGKTDDVALSRQMHDAHESLIRKPLVDAGKECVVWSEHMIWRHLMHHMIRPLASYMHMIRAVKTQMAELEKGLFTRSSASEPADLDKNKHKQWLELSVRLQGLLQAPGMRVALQDD